MSTRTNSTDWFGMGQRLCAPPIEGVGAIGPTTTVMCARCGDVIRSRPQAAGGCRVRYVLPVSDRGWCAGCEWVHS